MSDFETKYIANNAIAMKTLSWLKQNFPVDPNYPETIISSIYFDTFRMDYLDEKTESDHIKSKFRIRWYENIKTRKPSDICFLEFKHKVGENRFKKRIKCDNSYAHLALESEKTYSVMDELRIHGGNILKHVHPSYTVSYTRHRFVIPNTDIRLCIDFNINVKNINMRLVGPHFKQKYLSQCVFELKGETAILPPQLYYLEKLGFKKDAFSKYERCFIELIQ